MHGERVGPPSAEVGNTASACDMRVQRLAGCFVVHLTGEFDVVNASRLEERLRGLAALGEVVVDLQDVTYLDSSALRAMRLAHERAGGRGRRVHLARAQGVALKTVEVNGQGRQTHHADLNDAVRVALADQRGVEAP